MALNTSEANGFYKLNWLQRIGFGSGDLAQNLIYQTISMYLLFFYTNVFGLDPGVAAVMFLIVRIVDVIWDPIVGAFVDKRGGMNAGSRMNVDHECLSVGAAEGFPKGKQPAAFYR